MNERIRWPAHYTLIVLVVAAVFISYVDRTSISVGVIAMQTQLGWNETQKGLVLSSFFIGYIALMLASGVVANRYGGELVLGIAVLLWSLFTILTPPAALASLSTLVVARIALGAGEAALIPSSMNMIARWVPKAQRSRAVALITSVASLSTVFALSVTGWMVHRYSWKTPFYVFGVVGLLWVASWFARMSRGYGMQEPVSRTGRSIPWSALLRLRPLWAIVVTSFCFTWSFYVLGAWLPSYLKITFGVSLVNAGVLSAAPWLASFFCGNAAGYIADRMLHAGISATFVRKLMQTTGLVVGGMMLSLLPAASSLTAAVAVMSVATGAFAICYGGYSPNPFDIAPRYADVIWGLSNTFGALPGIIGVYATGWMVDRTGSFATPFYVTAGISFFGALIFLVFGSGKQLIE